MSPTRAVVKQGRIIQDMELEQQGHFNLEFADIISTANITEALTTIAKTMAAASQVVAPCTVTEVPSINIMESIAAEVELTTINIATTEFIVATVVVDIVVASAFTAIAKFRVVAVFGTLGDKQCLKVSSYLC